MNFLIYELTARALYLGERAKGNLFKACLRTIPFSAISGALNHRFGGAALNGSEGNAIKAVGFLNPAVDRDRVELLTYSPRDRVAGMSKIPLQVQFLADVLATVVVLDNDAARGLPENFEITLGGMRSNGFGQARLTLKDRKAAGNPRPGRLRVRLPEEEAGSFGIIRVLAPVYGYLFKPTPGTHTGVYVRSLFEGSHVVGPETLLQVGGG